MFHIVHEKLRVRFVMLDFEQEKLRVQMLMFHAGHLLLVLVDLFEVSMLKFRDREWYNKQPDLPNRYDHLYSKRHLEVNKYTQVDIQCDGSIIIKKVFFKSTHLLTTLRFKESCMIYIRRA